jgi:uncharacterized iron-regulated protein
LNPLARFCVITVCLLGATTSASASDPAQQCMGRVAQWLDPADGAVIAPGELFDRLSNNAIVLLGEVHDNADHHRWQLNTLAALHSRNDNLVVGLEMLPRKKQSVLDNWTMGELDEADFLEQAQWRELWGYDPDLYLPILHFARMNRLPAIAINIDRQLVSRVGAEGWQALKPSERMGLSEPAPASPAYRRSLGELYAYKLSRGMDDDSGDQGSDEETLQQVMSSEAFNHFVDAQLIWDRAMAEALATAHLADPDVVVAAIVGRGHLEYGYGIPHQLADLGIDDVAVLLPVDTDCGALETDLADAVFVVDVRADVEPPPGPRLGVMIENADGGVRIVEVVDDSVAADSDLRAGDVIVRAAGFETLTTSDLVEVIQRQAPGTWLPLEVLRAAREMQLTARFPQRFD